MAVSHSARPPGQSPPRCPGPPRPDAAVQPELLAPGSAPRHGVPLRGHARQRRRALCRRRSRARPRRCDRSAPHRVSRHQRARAPQPHAATGPSRATPLFALLTRCAELSAATDGAFDVTTTPLSRCWGFLRREGRLPAADEIAAALALVGMGTSRSRQTPRAWRSRPRHGAQSRRHRQGLRARSHRGELRAAGVRHALLSAGRSSLLALGGRDRGWPIDIISPRRAGRSPASSCATARSAPAAPASSSSTSTAALRPRARSAHRLAGGRRAERHRRSRQRGRCRRAIDGLPRRRVGARPALLPRHTGCSRWSRRMTTRRRPFVFGKHPRRRGARSMSAAQHFALVVLRTLIGWHFLYEGYFKLLRPAWGPDGAPLAAVDVGRLSARRHRSVRLHLSRARRVVLDRDARRGRRRRARCRRPVADARAVHAAGCIGALLLLTLFYVSRHSDAAGCPSRGAKAHICS